MLTYKLYFLFFSITKFIETNYNVLAEVKLTLRIINHA
jgi:hypothetical protein